VVVVQNFLANFKTASAKHLAGSVIAYPDVRRSILTLLIK
jgi:hypothetical protein